MPNIASVLKSEIARVARKAIRDEVDALKKAVSSGRTEIIALKRRTQSLELELRRLQKAVPRPAATPVDDAPVSTRFSAKGLASQRQRLELSAEACGLLLGTSGKSVYRWEAGLGRPRARYLPAIRALRTLSKKQAAELIAARQ